MKPSTLKKLLSLPSIRRQFLLKGRCSLPSQRTNGADVRGDMGNPKGDPVSPRTGAASFQPVYGKEHPWIVGFRIAGRKIVIPNSKKRANFFRI
jgi:hypothetical protein